MELVREFEANFAIKLPEEYLLLLKHSHGGGRSSTPYSLSMGETSVFGRLIGSNFSMDRRIIPKIYGRRPRTGDLLLGDKAVPFAENGGGDQFFLDLGASPPCVRLCIHDDRFKIIDIASSFEAFIDGLGLDSDRI